MRARIPDLVKPEFLTSQIEVATPVCRTCKEARAELARLRRTVAEVSGKYGLAPIAASTHPFSQWRSQRHTDRARYHTLARDMQAVARRLLICGMHVHVGVEDDELRIDLMNQVSYFLPHLLALSTSSPFWLGEDSGLKSYRLSVFDELPRTGLPSRFESYGEYKRHVDVLVDAGMFDDASMLWWDVRPSCRFPDPGDAHHRRLHPHRRRARHRRALSVDHPDACSPARDNQRWRAYDNMLIEENRWRAKRYGIDEGLIDFGKGEVVPCADLLEELIELTKQDAEALDCVDEVASQPPHLEDRHQRPSPARDVRRCHGGRDAAVRRRFIGVVDMLIEETISGL